MKLMVLLVVIATIQVTANTYGQKVSIHSKGESLKVVLKKLRQQTGKDFLYNSNEIDENKKVNLSVNQASWNSALETLLTPHNWTYIVNGKTVLIQPLLKTPAANQQSKLTGVVKNQQGEPIVGATVTLNGTLRSVATNAQGVFIIDQAPESGTIRISNMGYQDQVVAYKNGILADITLLQATQEMDEVVIVGYGIQSKKELIGSVSQVAGSEIAKRSVPSLSQALTGQMPGVTVIQRSGQPGASGGAIQIRGVGSFGAETGALILVDGIPTSSFNDIDPNDVASISVLKDASSAAIYGARAANGVILVTTKTGSIINKLTISYNGNLGLQKPTAYPEFVNSWEYAQAINETTAGGGGYTDSEIEKFKNGSDPDNYPNSNFFDEFFKSSAMMTGHNVNIANKSERTQYSLSIGYLDQKGILKKNSYDRYNTRLNLVTNLRDNLKLTTRLSGTLTSDNQPAAPATLDFSDMKTIISQVIRYPAIHAIRLSNGDWGPGNNLKGTPISFLESQSFYKENKADLGANMRLDWNLIPDLTLSAIGGYTQQSSRIRLFRATQRINDNITLAPSSLRKTNPFNNYRTFQALADYKKKIGHHDFKILGGYSFEQGYDEELIGFRQGFPSNDLTELNVGSPDGQTSNGKASEWALESLFGRAQYNFAGKYLIEGVLRYDGSSRFSQAKKYAVFPSLAAGWIISEESFFKNNISWINELKLKGSYGVLGNQNIGRYPYQNILNTGSNYSFGNSIAPGLARKTIIDPNLKWESTRTSDLGIEGRLLQHKISFGATYYDRYTYDILVSPSGSVSGVLGFDVGLQNSGKLKNRGLEFTLGYQDRKNEWSYGVNLNYSTVTNEVIDLGVGNITQPNGLVGNGELFIGLPMQMYYGYKTDGLFVDQADIDSWANMKAVNPSAKPGDIRYVDISGPDGVPDGKIDPNYDRTSLGSRIPKHTFGANMNVSYKNFDFSVLLQGVSGVNGLLENFAGYAMYGNGNIQRWQYDGRWTPENPDRGAAYPRMEQLASIGSPNTIRSDFWVMNASYLRVKNLQLGYRLPSAIATRWGVENLRINASVENLHTWNSYRKGWDPELNSDGNFYPIMRNFSLGLNFNF